MRVACLVDTTRCIGCRSCQIACKQSNGLKTDSTRFFAAAGGYQNPGRFSPNTRTFVQFHEKQEPSGKPAWIFVKLQCLHCGDLFCAHVCAADVFEKTDTGVVNVHPDRCMGCAACIDACPFQVPTIDYWDRPVPCMSKCTFCLERQQAKERPAEIDKQPLSPAGRQRLGESLRMPACVKACPSGALVFGNRDVLLAEARRRLNAEPSRYVAHIYGEKEAGGTGWLYLAALPFDQLDFPISFPSKDSFNPLRRMGSHCRPSPLMAESSQPTTAPKKHV